MHLMRDRERERERERESTYTVVGKDATVDKQTK